MELDLAVKHLHRLRDRIVLPVYRACRRIRESHRRLVAVVEAEREAAREPRPKIFGPTWFPARFEAGGASFQMLLLRPGHLEDMLVKNGCWEPHLLLLMRQFMRPDGLFVDVGANIGYHSLAVAAAFPGARCLAFEPNPVVFRQLARNKELNPHLAHLAVHELAIGEACGEVGFVAQEEGAYNRGLSGCRENFDLAGEPVRRIRVPVSTLDAFLEDADKDRVAVIKIDTQGGERGVLKGAAETIRRSRPAVLFEFEAPYHPDGPEGEFAAICRLLPGHDVFLVRNDDSGGFRRFEPWEVRGRDRFEGDFICLPKP